MQSKPCMNKACERAMMGSVVELLDLILRTNHHYLEGPNFNSMATFTWSGLEFPLRASLLKKSEGREYGGRGVITWAEDSRRMNNHWRQQLKRRKQLMCFPKADSTKYLRNLWLTNQHKDSYHYHISHGHPHSTTVRSRRDMNDWAILAIVFDLA